MENRAASYQPLIFVLQLLPMLLISTEHSILNFTNAANTEKHFVTYGSSVNLLHPSSKFRIYGHEINWTGGSGQQVVTAAAGEGSLTHNHALWVVKEAHGRSPIQTGVSVKCGDVLRFENAATGRNLHAQSVPSVLTSHNEVSTFGEDGVGNKMDDFIVECAADNESGYLTAEEKFNLKHAALGGYLSAQKAIQFTQSNCPNCPIVGHMEVVVTNAPIVDNPSDAKWRATAGVIFKPDSGWSHVQEYDEL